MSNKWIAPLVAFLLLAVCVLAPPIAPITSLGMKVIGIFGFTMIMWLFEGLGHSSFLCLALVVILGVMPLKDTFAISTGNHLAVFTIAAFGLAQALRYSGFSRRLALWFVSRRITAGRPWVFMAMFWFATWFMGCFTSGSATCITFMTIAEPMLVELGYKKGDHLAAMLMVGIAWCATIAFISTPIGHTTNFLFIEWMKRDTGYAITFPKWIIGGAPVSLLFLASVLAYFRFALRLDMEKFKDAAANWVREEAGKLGPMKPEEKVAIGVFLAVVVCWLIPGFFMGIMPGVAGYFDKMGVAIPPLVGACLLCVIKFKNKPVLSFQEWMGGVAWETFALLGAIYVFAELMGNPKTGLSEFFAQTFAPVATGAPFFVYRAVAQFWVLIQTQLMSNTVSATTVYQALMPTAIATKIGNPVALGFAIWFGARCAFATPSASTNCALVTGSGWVPVPFIIRHGIMVSIIAALLALFVVYPWCALIFRV